MRTTIAGCVMAVALVAAGTPAESAIVADFVQVGTQEISGTQYNIWELQITTDANWTNAELLIELTDGTMFQHSNEFNVEGIEPSSQAVINLYPDAAFDTFAAMPPGNVAPDFIGLTEISADRFFANWFDSPPAATGPGTWSIAQITLSTDAAGTIAGYVADSDTVVDFFDGTHGSTQRFAISNGGFVPEPGTLVLLGVGGLAMVARRRAGEA